MLMILFLTLLTQLVASEEFVVYTHESIRDDNDKPCLTGCSPDTKECITEARGSYREKRSCRILDEPAPIYLTSQKEDPGRKHCLSNCGPFNMYFSHEWCFTRKDFRTWDYCSTNNHRSFLTDGHPQGMTSNKTACTDQCSKSREKPYFWCHYGAETWDTCALSAIPRIPVLHNNFHVGEKNKDKCDDFLRYTRNIEFEQSSYSTSADVPDNYITDIAEAIEAIGNNALSQVITINDAQNPVEGYSLVKIRDIMVPAVIRAHITKDSINIIRNGTETSPTIERKLRQQMSGTRDSYEAGTLIGFDLGGPNADYNLVPRSLGWKCDDWTDMEEAVKNWCRKTGGSVDMLIVTFYRDAKTPIPRAFGVSLIFRNADHSVFIDCREKIYYNNF